MGVILITCLFLFLMICQDIKVTQKRESEGEQSEKPCEREGKQSEPMSEGEGEQSQQSSERETPDDILSLLTEGNYKLGFRNTLYAVSANT